MAEYDKNSIYKVSAKEGIEEGLFIGISNKHYQDMWNYWCYLDFCDNFDEHLARKMTQEEIEEQLGYKIHIVDKK